MSHDSVSYTDFQFNSHIIPKDIYKIFPVRESLLDEHCFIIKRVNSEFSKNGSSKSIFLMSIDDKIFYDPFVNPEPFIEYTKIYSKSPTPFFDIVFSNVNIKYEIDGNSVNIGSFLQKEMYKYRERQNRYFYSLLNEADFLLLIHKPTEFRLYQIIDLVESCMTPLSIAQHDSLWEKYGMSDCFYLNKCIYSIYMPFYFGLYDFFWKLYTFRMRKEYFYTEFGFSCFLWELKNHLGLNSRGVNRWKKDVFYDLISNEWVFITSKRFYDSIPEIQHDNESISDHDLPDFYRFLCDFDYFTIKYGIEKRLMIKFVRLLMFSYEKLNTKNVDLINMPGSKQYISFYGSFGYLAIFAKIPRSHNNYLDFQNLILNDLLANNYYFYIYCCNLEKTNGLKTFVRKIYDPECRLVKILIIFNLLNAKGFCETLLDIEKPNQPSPIVGSDQLIDLIDRVTIRNGSELRNTQTTVFNEDVKNENGDPILEGSYIVKELDYSRTNIIFQQKVCVM